MVGYARRAERRACRFLFLLLTIRLGCGQIWLKCNERAAYWFLLRARQILNEPVHVAKGVAMRKLLIAAVIVILVLVGIVFVVPMLVDVNQYRGQVQAELQKQLNRPVQLGSMGLSVIPLAVKVDNVTIGEDPSFHSNVPFAQVQQLDVHVKLFPLLAKKIEISSLTLQQPKIELIRNAAGVWNFGSLGQKPAAPAKPSAPAAQAPATPAAPAAQPSGVELSKLSIKDGQIAVTDYQKHEPRAVYDHIDLTLKDFAPNQPFSLDVAAHLPGKGSQTLELSGKGGPNQQRTARQHSFHRER